MTLLQTANRMEQATVVEKYQNCGIYLILNTKNGYIYVGSSVNIKRRWSKHLTRLRNNSHENKHLQRAWLLYGENNFSFSILETVSKEELFCKEQFYIDKLNPQYNILRFAGSPRGMRHTEETKEKLRILSTGVVFSEERRKKLRDWQIGKKLSEDHKNKISIALRGKEKSAEAKKNMSLGQIGKIFSKETIEKMRKSRLRFIERQKSESVRD